MELKYTLPAKAVEIIEELAENELNQVSFYLYLSFCCSNAGYYDAADRFMQQSKDERYHFTRFSDFLQSRGVEGEVPEVKAPKIVFTDLKSGIEAAYKLEIEITEKYDEAIKMMRDIDTMAYLKLCEYLTSQQYNLDSLQKAWTTFKDLAEGEDQHEAERSFFGCKDVENSPVSGN